MWVACDRNCTWCWRNLCAINVTKKIRASFINENTRAELIGWKDVHFTPKSKHIYIYIIFLYICIWTFWHVLNEFCILQSKFYFRSFVNSCFSRISFFIIIFPLLQDNNHFYHTAVKKVFFSTNLRYNKYHFDI